MAFFGNFLPLLAESYPPETTKARRIMTAEGYHHRDSLSFPSDRPTRPFTCVGAAVGLLQSQFPLQPIANATLESKGSFETIGFKRLFCPLFQLLGKVGRRRHVPVEVTHRRENPQRGNGFPRSVCAPARNDRAIFMVIVFSSP